MAAVTSLGVGSGLDLKTLLDGLQKSQESSFLTPITRQQASVKNEITAYGTLQGALTSLQASVKALGDAKTFEALSSSVTGSGVAAAVTSKAVAGTYAIEVTSLAKAQSLVSPGVADKAAKLGVGTLTISQPGAQGEGAAAPLEITLDASNNSLEGIRDAINAKGGGVTASLVNDGSANPYRLVLTSNATGTESAINVSFAGTGEAATLLGYDSAAGTGVMSETVQAVNAELTINGIAIVSQSNTVEEAVQGTTLSLTAEGAQSLTVKRDTDSIKSAINAFVKSYNAYESTLDNLTAYDQASDAAGVLQGDSATRRIDRQLAADLYTPVAGGAFSLLSELGITLRLDGSLEVDDEVLDAAIAKDVGAVSGFFSGGAGGGGFAAPMAANLNSYLDKNEGLFASINKGLDSQVKELGERFISKQAAVDSLMARYSKQFSALDGLISRLNSTADYLTQQFDALNKDK